MSEFAANYHRIQSAIGFLTENFRKQPGLDEIARNVNMSPFHFQRIFTDWVGISPKKFTQYLTVDFLRAKLADTQNMIEAAELAGLSSQSRVHDLFVSVEGVSAHQFKTSGAGLNIFYGYHPSPFGMCFIAITERGICALKFIDEDHQRTELKQFCEQWSFARIVHGPEYTQDVVRRIFQPDKINREKLHLLVQGTDFQIKVWEALVNIPFGSVSSFQQIANLIGEPGAVRSVGSAVGKNSILYLIPCHRIISKDGSAGNYHYGKIRKQAMIGWEMSKSQQ